MEFTMQTTTDIANFAFMNLGGVGQINDINDNSNPAILARSYMTAAMKHVLGMAAWVDMIQRRPLLSGGSLIDSWTYSYLLPNDWVWTVAYLKADNTEMGEGEYYMEGGKVYCNEANVVCKYVSIPTDISRMEEHLAQCVGLHLAYLMAPDLSSSDEQKVQRIRLRFSDTRGRAIAVNARNRKGAAIPETWGVI